MKRMLLFIGWSLCAAVPLYLWSATMAAQGGEIALLDVAGLLGHLAYAFLFLQACVILAFPWTEPLLGTQSSYEIHEKFGLMALTALLSHGFLFVAVYGGLPRGFFLWPAHAAFFLLCLNLLLSYGAKAGVIGYHLWAETHKSAALIFPLFFLHGALIFRGSYSTPIAVYYGVLFLLFMILAICRLKRGERLKRHAHKILDIIKENHEVWTVVCEKKRFKYVPGQYAFIRTIHNGRISAPHPFSMTSQPREKNVAFTVKWVGDFSSTIHHLKPGDSLVIDGPYGQFSFLKYDSPEMVFIAGGIGITPLFSMLRYAHAVKSRHPILLLWGNKRKDDIIFRQELKQMTLDMERFKVVHILSREKSKRGERGHVDEERIKKYVEQPYRAHYFICGPAGLQKNTVRILKEMGVEEKRIHVEKFSVV
ncbi:hypothetical protein JXR74_03105 [Candidatus Mcinerneyibacteriota bacterium]|nr:hypothetical protein [Candidatus Mcinerneyibacteriota bacterium]